MKGIVFTELLDMVAQRYGDNLVDDMIFDAAPPHGGAYTSVGTYPHTELVDLVNSMSRRTGSSVDTLLEVFGLHLFGRFYVSYPKFMDQVTDPLDFLMGIETVVHSEVRKLYPDAQLPEFEVSRTSSTQIVMNYRSAHDFSSLAVGLLKGCAQHYGCTFNVQRSTPDRIDNKVMVQFTVSRDV